MVKINDAAGKPAKTVFIVHEDSAFGTGMAKLLNNELPKRGFTVLEHRGASTPTRDFTNIVLKVKAAEPDIVIPANYYNEYVLFVRTLVQQRVQPKGDLFDPRRRRLEHQIRARVQCRGRSM